MKVNSRKPRQAQLRKVGRVTGEQDQPFEMAAVMTEVYKSVMGAPRSRGIESARSRSYLTNAEHGNPVRSGGHDQPPVGEP
jgi:hypothetical protein